MKRVFKQWLAGLLSVALLFTLLPAAALAEETDGSMETAVEQVQALIDELPDAAEITADNRADVQAQIDAIETAMAELTEDQAAALDTARYDAAAATLLALDAPSALEQVQALIDSLPDAEEITAETRDDVQAQLTAIDEAKLALEDDELDELDITRYMAAVEAILALDDMAGADEPMPIAATSHNMSSGSLNIGGDGEYTVTGSTISNTITVTGGNVTITLNNVSVASVNGCAFDIQGGNVTLILAEGTTNYFASGGGNAGIQVDIDAHLTIKGTGAVTAIAKKGADTITGAGIGGSSTQHAGYITIESGTIVAKSEGDGAGIGGGHSGTGGGVGASGMFKAITINGGNVTAEAYGEGAAIGCGGGSQVASMETITITGGLIHAKSAAVNNYASDIGYGGFHTDDGGTVSITGGMIFCEGTHGRGIGAQTVKKNNCLIIHQAGDIELFGNVTVLENLTFSGSRSLTIQGGQTLTIPAGVTLTNYWDIVNCGKIIVNGTLINYGTIKNVKGSGSITGSVQENQPGSLDGTPYLDWDENAKKLIPCATPTVTEMTNQSGWLENGWYIVNSDITYTGRMFIAGDDVHLILADGCTLTVTEGINVNYYKKVTIYGQTNGTGKLETTTTDMYNSSFGTGDQTNCGSITINGGTVIATSKYLGAGIGSGRNGQINDGDAITINGGTVIATSQSGAGIGSGNESRHEKHNAGTIIINGGTVIATSNSGAGIGGGSGTSGGWVTINGGTVTATSKGGGSGIGAGKDPVKHSYANGSFSTGTNGSAVIFANSISDQNGKGSWGGIIFEGSSGQVYGNQTLRQDLALSSGQSLTVPNGTSLTVPSGMTLTVPSGATVTNSGTINVGTKTAPGGSINVSGAINNTGTIDVWGGIEGENNIKNSGSGKVVYHFKLDITAPAFAEVKYGYSRPEKMAITIKNTGEVEAAITSVEITGNSFDLVGSNKGSLTKDQSNTSWTLQPRAGLNAGKYTETITVKYTGNGGAVRTATAEVTFNVGKADPVVTPPTANSLTYNGSAQSLVQAGSATGGTMQYSLEQNGAYSTAIPKGTAAGSYKVWYKVVGDGNYNGTTPASLDVTIGRAESGITASNVTATYGDDITLTATVKGSGVQGISLMSLPNQDKVRFTFKNDKYLEADVTYADPARKDSGTATVTILAADVKQYLDPGTNTVTVSYGGSINLNGKDSATMTVTVNQKTLAYDVKATGRVYAKDNREVTVALTPNNLVAGANDDVTLTAKGTVDSADANTYSSIALSEITMAGNDKGYYTVVSTATSNTSVTIEPKEVSLTWALDGKAEMTTGYTGTVHTVTATADTDISGESVNVTVENGEKSNAGTYTAKAIGLTDGEGGKAGNYKLPGAVTQDYTITPAKVSFTIGDEDKTDWNWESKGETNADPNAETNGYTVNSPASWTDYVLSMTYDSYPHTANVAQTESETVKIEAKAVNGFTVTYNRIKDSSGGSVTENETDSVRDAGTYEIWVTINPVEGSIYNYVFDGHDSVHNLKIGEITVEPFPTAVSWAHQKYVYHGHTMHPEIHVLAPFKADNMQMASGLPEGFDHEHPEAYTGDYLEAFAETAGSDVGVYPVEAKLYGKNAGNYTITDPTGSVTITPAPVTFTVGDNTWIVQEDGTLSRDEVTLRPAWGAITVAPDAEEATDHQYPLAGSAITEGLDPRIEYRDPKTGEAVEVPTEPGTYEVWVEIGNTNLRHSGATNGALHNVGELVITNDPGSVKSYTVKFDPDYEGAPAGPADMTGVFANQTVVIPPVSGENEDESTYNIARKGWSFLGWSYNGHTYKPNEEFHMPASDVTFKAEWIEAVDVGGTVKQGNDQNAPGLSGATVTLKQGSEEVAEVVTKGDGTFTFPQVTPGVYNLEVSYHSGDTEIVKTFLVEVGADSDTPEVYLMPQKALNTVVEVAPGITAAVNMERITESQETSTVYTADDKKTVEDGGKVEFKMNVRGAELTSEQAQEVPVPEDRIGMVLTLELTKTVTPKNGESKKPEDIHDAKVPVTTIIHLPAELQGKSSYTIYRFHDMEDEENSGTTVMQTITTSPNSEGEYLEIIRDGTAIEIHAEFYSTYVLTWQQSSGGSGSSTTVKSAAAVNGSFSVSNRNARAGDTVKITPKADKGFAVDQVTVTDRNGKAVEVKDNGDGTYSFIMPARAAQPVTVEVTFLCDGGDNCPTRDYTDVDQGAWYHRYVDYAVEHGLMAGVGGGLFEPDGTVSRAQMVTVLWNLSGKPVVDYYMTYSDVTEDVWYSEAVRWATSEGIASGYGNGNFGPGDPITREQMAVMIYHYEQKCGSGGFTGDWMYRLPFTDLDKLSDWAVEAVAWCNMKGIIVGTGNNIFAPKGLAKRSEAAAILTHYCCGESSEE